MNRRRRRRRRRRRSGLNLAGEDCQCTCGYEKSALQLNDKT
jgi:hypothetical protein